MTKRGAVTINNCFFSFGAVINNKKNFGLATTQLSPPWSGYGCIVNAQ